MVKKFFQRGTIGFLMGVFITVLIPVLISFTIGDGKYYPIVPAFTEQCGNEINAAAIQYLLGGILGFMCAASSIIFNIEKFGILKQSFIHFLCISISMLPIAYICHWMEHSLLGILSYYIIFISIYFVIFISQYMFWKSKIKKMNEKLSKASK